MTYLTPSNNIDLPLLDFDLIVLSSETEDGGWTSVRVYAEIPPDNPKFVTYVEVVRGVVHVFVGATGLPENVRQDIVKTTIETLKREYIRPLERVFEDFWKPEKVVKGRVRVGEFPLDHINIKLKETNVLCYRHWVKVDFPVPSSGGNEQFHFTLSFHNEFSYKERFQSIRGIGETLGRLSVLDSTVRQYLETFQSKTTNSLSRKIKDFSPTSSVDVWLRLVHENDESKWWVTPRLVRRFVIYEDENGNPIKPSTEGFTIKYPTNLWTLVHLKRIINNPTHKNFFHTFLSSLSYGKVTSGSSLNLRRFLYQLCH